MIKSIYKNGKSLRYGYTTGSCAAAAAKAASIMLIEDRLIDSVDLMTPKGWLLKLDVVDIDRGLDYVSCAIIKDSGDDPDITNGIKVYAKVKRQESGIDITGGIGVGYVTKKGLPVKPNNYAINPVPLKMIYDNVSSIHDGLHVTISVPEGVEIAKKTFNPKLGIEGGISILGTTGIVEPMSEEAFKDSLAIELNMINYTDIVLAPGNYGRDYCLKQGIDDKRILKISNFVGFMFDRVVESKKTSVLFVGHIGKLIKVAGGIFHTHSRVSDARLDILVNHMVKAKIDYDHLLYVGKCNTTDEAVNYLVDHGLNFVFDDIADSVKKRLEDYTLGSLKVEVILFSTDQGALAKTQGAREMMEVMSE